MKISACLLSLVTLASAVTLKDAAVTLGGDGPIEPFIISGEEAKPSQFPYQAAVYMDSAAFCGGSLISPRWVLTAAHCVKGVAVFTVYLGAHNMMKPRETQRQVFSSRIGIHHEKYDPSTVQNDMGLVQLGRDVILNDHVSIVRLPSKSQLNQLFANTSAVVSGWGKMTNVAPTISSVLRFVGVTIISNEACTDKYDSEPIFPTTLCAQGDSKKSTCNGDSGGPLVIIESDGAPTQVGVVSFVSDSGCDKSFPHGYSRLTAYMPWVSEKTGISIRP